MVFQSCEICWEHVEKELERILLCKNSGNAELKYKYTYMNKEDDSDNLDEYSKNSEYLSHISHIKEYTEETGDSPLPPFLY